MSGPITRDDLAIDHALGLAEGEHLERAERLMDSDAGFRRTVQDWRRRLTEIDDTAPKIEPDPGLYPRIEAALARPERRVAARPPNASFWENLAVWRGLGLAGALASLVLAVGLTAALLRGPDTPIFVAVLERDDGRPAAVVNAFADGTAVLVPMETIEVPEGRVLEVWTLQSRERGPVSIGLIERARTIRLDLTKLPKTGASQLFEITLEPQGGSPVGRPTGPVLMKGLTAQSL